MPSVALSLPDAFRQALRAYESGRLADCERLCRAILGIVRDHVDANHLLGLVQYRCGLWNEALASFEKARAVELARRFEMAPLLDRRAGGFSQGERMKTALCRALVHDPPNIVLDEPTNGLDVLATRALRDSLRWLRTPDGGAKCIVFSTHIMQEVERLCDGVVVVAHGRTVATGTVDELLAKTGQQDFEEAFVELAFAAERAAAGAPS